MCVGKCTIFGVFRERFNFTARRYLNLTKADSKGAECQNCAFALLSNAHITPISCRNIVSRLVNRNNEGHTYPLATGVLSEMHMGDVLSICNAYVNSTNVSSMEVDECISCVRAAKDAATLMRKNHATHFNSLSGAATEL